MNSQKILSEDDPFGAKVMKDGRTRFRLWAPLQQQMMDEGSAPSAPRLLLPDSDSFFPMTPLADGWFESYADAPHGTRYAHEVWIPHGETPGWKQVPGQMSYWQEENVYGYSKIVDPARLTRGTKPWNGVPHENLIIQQIHLQTFTEEGTLLAAIEKLQYLKDSGFTALQLLPLEENDASRNWGYDGVLKTAIQQEYGTPENLAEFIAAAHDHGLAVFTDNVYNHWGPKGNYLEEYAPEFWHYADPEKAARLSPGERQADPEYKSPWGSGVNIDRAEVRKYIEQIEWYYQVVHQTDGVRRDAVHAIRDTEHEQNPSAPHLLTTMTRNAERRAEETGIEFHVINEDQNDRATRYDYHRGRSEGETIGHMQWADNLHHAVYAAIAKDWMHHNEDLAKILTAEGSYYSPYVYTDSVDLIAEIMTTGNAYSLDTARNEHATDEDKNKKPDLRTKIFFSTNHDQIGNTPKGLRLSELLNDDPYKIEKLDLRDTIVMLSPAVPQFYMGQSWRSESRFPFFAKWHDEELNEIVSKGRHEELSHFPKEEFIPPHNDEAFLTAKLDWDRAASNVDEIRKFQSLVEARNNFIIPHLSSGIKKSETERFGDSGLRVTHTFGDGAGFSMLLNLGATPADYGMYRLPAWGALYKDIPDYKPVPEHLFDSPAL